jgi:hypothetical protein
LILQHKKDRERAEETKMNTSKLQTILGYLNIGLAIAHDSGVTIGHFGATDFIQLAESVNGLLLSAFAPAASSSTVSSGSASIAAGSAASGATADAAAPGAGITAVS